MATLAEVVQAIGRLDQNTVSGLQSLSTVIGTSLLARGQSQTGADGRPIPDSEQFTPSEQLHQAASGLTVAVQRLLSAF